jgi:hypothetical protein
MRTTLPLIAIDTVIGIDTLLRLLFYLLSTSKRMPTSVASTPQRRTAAA